MLPARRRRWPRPTCPPPRWSRRPRLAGADALHPGYGFLSENPACPRPAPRRASSGSARRPTAMRVMGHKARAKELVAAAGVPVLPSAVVRDRGRRRRAARAAAERRLPAPRQGVGRRRGPRHAPRRATRTSWSTRWRRPSARRRPRSARTRSSWSGTSRPPATSRCRSSGDSHGTVAAPARPGVLGAAPPPEGGRGGAGRPGARRRSAGRCGRPRVAVARAVGYVGVGTVEYLVDGDELLLLSR